MNHINYRISLDMFDTSSQITIKAKKGDSACKIHITLTENGKIYNIAEGCYATFSAKKSDGNFIYGNCTIEGNTIVYDFTSSIDENGVFHVLMYCCIQCDVMILVYSDGKNYPKYCSLKCNGGEQVEKRYALKNRYKTHQK